MKTNPTRPNRFRFRNGLGCVLCLLSICAPFASAQRGDKKNEQQQDPIPLDAVPPSPVLSPEKALAAFQVEDGFEVQLVAAEPMVVAPVWLKFDEKGRLWVAEMIGYMPNLNADGEQDPVGRISVLWDTNGDGAMDEKQVFLDKLVLPRSLAFINGGLLYATPPGLWWVKIGDDLKPAGEPVLVDGRYAVGGNVEHQPNGLLRNLDGWFYNAKSNQRYRFEDGAWIREETVRRGQWGITRDDFGRLYYNTNSNQLRGDQVLPQLTQRNRAMRPNEGTNTTIVGDQTVYPIRLNTGVNRGYRKGTLREDGRLAKFTAASGPVVYRGHQFPEAYYGNAFVPEPAGNLIKRNILAEEKGMVVGKQASNDSEFLASTDERFRPVNLHNAPDGTLYICDMYRGVIQHKAFVTSYLRRQIESRSLVAPLDRGRIWRVVAKGSPVKPVAVAANPAALSHRNGWVRDTARRLLVDGEADLPVEALEQLAGDNTLPWPSRLDALWTLENRDAVKPTLLASLFKSSEPKVVVHALRIAQPYASGSRASSLIRQLKPLASHPDRMVRVYLGSLLVGTKGTAASQARKMMMGLAESDGGDALFRAAVISGAAGREAQWAGWLDGRSAGATSVAKDLNAVVKEKEKQLAASKITLEGDALQAYLNGQETYTELCMGCHQADGKGAVPLAPPLRDSEWVTGSPDRLAKVLLAGLTGPIEVAGKTYAPPQVQELMPGLIDNEHATDERIAEVMTYIRNAWGNKADPVAPGAVQKARAAVGSRREPYTAKELNP